MDNLNFKKWQKTEQKWQIYGEKWRDFEHFQQYGTLFNYYGGTLFVSIFLNGVKNSREDAKKMLKSAGFHCFAISKSGKNSTKSSTKADKTCKFLYIFGNRLTTIDKFTVISSDINK